MESKCEEEYVTLAVQYSVLWNGNGNNTGLIFNLIDVALVLVASLYLAYIWNSKILSVLYASAKGIWVDGGICEQYFEGIVWVGYWGIGGIWDMPIGFTAQ